MSTGYAQYLSMQKKTVSRKLIRIFFLLLLVTITQLGYAQDSSRIRISLLTCSPGDELYSIFGHSAIRVIDSNSVTDYVFNYGTFDFNDEGFYLKFMRGKLRYFVSIENSVDFINNYAFEGREIIEQVIQLSSDEKINIKNSLIENLKEENKYYKYDFFYDNCTSRLRDIIVKSKQPLPILPAAMPIKTTFRDAIHTYLENGHQYWSELGIDLLLGARTDKVMTATEQCFLPDNLKKSLEYSKNPSIIESSSVIISKAPKAENQSWLNPLFLFISFAFIYLFFSFLKNPMMNKILTSLDQLLFFTSGILGFLLLVMWTMTDHSMTKNNYNLLWAIPTNIIFCFFISRSNPIIKKYFKMQSIVLFLLLCAWAFIPQKLNNSLVPVVILLTIRSYRIGIK